jgi:hypothetical protein
MGAYDRWRLGLTEPDPPECPVSCEDEDCDCAQDIEDRWQESRAEDATDDC